MQLLLWFALAIDGVILVAMIVKWRQVALASKWPAATGRIVASEAEARRISKTHRVSRSRSIGDDVVESSEVRNFAAVRYAFNVGQAKFHGNRIGFGEGENTGNTGIAETLKRYPKGTKVTVYYDPANPRNCVLDRDPPSEGFFRNVFGIVLAVGAIIVAMLLGANGKLSAGSFALPELHWTRARVFAACLAFCAFILVSAAVRLQRIRRRWLMTSGRIVSSEAVKLHAVTRWLNPRRYFKGRTVYEYVVDGVRYQSDRIGFDDMVFSTSRLIAEDDADRFSPGSRVDVYYDPDAPSSAVLDLGNPWLSWWWLGAAAIAFLLLFGMALASLIGGAA